MGRSVGVVRCKWAAPCLAGTGTMPISDGDRRFCGTRPLSTPGGEGMGEGEGLCLGERGGGEIHMQYDDSDWDVGAL